MRHATVFAGTYHKTGTVWMKRVMRDTAAAVGVAYHFNAVREYTGGAIAPGIYFDERTRFPEALAAIGGTGFRMIRDPRDVVISGAQYHLRSDEAWLHIERRCFNGRTYQQAIRACEGVQAQYIFEMRNAGANTIKLMVAPNAFVAGLATVRYESLMLDSDFSRFRKLAGDLGLEGPEIDHAVTSFKTHSLVGSAESTGDHGTSEGKLERWRREFSRATAEAFAEEHGDALIALGYEADRDWVRSCRG